MVFWKDHARNRIVAAGRNVGDAAVGTVHVAGVEGCHDGIAGLCNRLGLVGLVGYCQCRTALDYDAIGIGRDVYTRDVCVYTCV